MNHDRKQQRSSDDQRTGRQSRQGQGNGSQGRDDAQRRQGGSSSGPNYGDERAVDYSDDVDREHTYGGSLGAERHGGNGDRTPSSKEAYRSQHGQGHTGYEGREAEQGQFRSGQYRGGYGNLQHEDEGRSNPYGGQNPYGAQSAPTGSGEERFRGSLGTEGEHRDRGESTFYAGTYRRSSQPFDGGRGMLHTESLTLSGPYAGKGPKGYKRSDAQICEDANQALERDGRVDASEIEVECKEGVITLTGKIENRRAKRDAEECVEDVYGVRDVMNQLKVDEGFFAKLFGNGSDKND